MLLAVHTGQLLTSHRASQVGGCHTHNRLAYTTALPPPAHNTHSFSDSPLAFPSLQGIRRKDAGGKGMDESGQENIPNR